ncbi:hypothetical protein FWF89_01390 [Candidatus Saccharibacteria bacterium]|nr:hypothetical protein [Candidatus Saccharibacteria bacterium]
MEENSTGQPLVQPQPAKEPVQGNTEIRNYAQGEMLTDGRICALFLAGWASSPVWQFDLVFKDLARAVSDMAIKYADFGQKSFNPEEISDKVAEEIGKKEYGRYLVVGMGLGGQLAYKVLTKLDAEMTQRTTGILFSTPASGVDIKDAGKLLTWILQKQGLAKFLDKFRKIYWKIFGKKKDTNKFTDEMFDTYAHQRAYESQFSVDTFFTQASYFYGFAADKPVGSRLVVVDAIDDKFLKVSVGWDKVAKEIDHRKITGGNADSIVSHMEYARIIMDEEGREEQLLHNLMEKFGVQG